MSVVQRPSVNWPAVLKHTGDPELVYVVDLPAWERDADIQALDCDASDCLIDSSGTVFSLVRRADGRLAAESRGATLTLEDALGLVKAHAAQLGSCCVAKLYAPSIREAFNIVKAINDSEGQRGS